MEIQEMTVMIERDGTVRLEVRGVKGPRCLDLTKSIEGALGGQVKSRELTSEHKAAATGQLAATLSIKPGR
jgi:hypothetical protein